VSSSRSSIRPALRHTARLFHCIHAAHRSPWLCRRRMSSRVKRYFRMNCLPQRVGQDPTLCSHWKQSRSVQYCPSCHCRIISDIAQFAIHPNSSWSAKETHLLPDHGDLSVLVSFALVTILHFLVAMKQVFSSSRYERNSRFSFTVAASYGLMGREKAETLSHEWSFCLSCHCGKMS
jgi:hypothetical protein